MFDHTTGSQAWHRNTLNPGSQVWHRNTLNPITKGMKIWWEKWPDWRLSEQCAEDPSLQEGQAVNECGLWGFRELYCLHHQRQAVQVHSLLTASHWRRHFDSWKHQQTVHPETETEHNITAGLNLNEEKMQGSWSLARQRTCGHINKMDVDWSGSRSCSMKRCNTISVENLTIQNNKFICCFLQVCNLVSASEGSTMMRILGSRRQNTVRWLNIVQWVSSHHALFIKYHKGNK